ncbi:MAG: hypothetical protein JSV84_06435 [Gemmatimonadota bacterium]|nr:MAG: hypothetical protein JSV84_06435 [Gemmatimonadota bacterium]
MSTNTERKNENTAPCCSKVENSGPKRRSLFPALFLIFIGSLFLLRSFDIIRWHDVWPILLFGVGVLLFCSAFGKKDRGAVFPGTILVFIGAFFYLWKNYYLPWYMDELWPVFPLIVGLAFFVLFLFSPREWGVLIPAAMLTFVSAIFFLNNFGTIPWSAWALIGRTWPIVLIVIGVLILVSHTRKRAP